MSPAARSLHRRAVAAAALVACLGLTACGGPAEPGPARSSGAPTGAVASPSASGSSDPTPSASATPSADTADRVVVDISIAGGRVTPSGEKVQVAVGQEVQLNVTSDVDDEIHAHTDSADGYALEVKAGVPATGTFRVSSPGSFEVESHDLEKIIVILNVR